MLDHALLVIGLRAALVDRQGEDDALMLAKLGRDVIEFQYAAFLAVSAWPDCADFASWSENVIAVFVLADDAGKGDPVKRSRFCV